MGRQRKHTDGRYDRERLPLADGQEVGSNGIVLDANAGRDRFGHLLVLVRWDCRPSCKDCHGKPKLIRADNLQSARIKSCGRIKRALRSQYMREKNARTEASTLRGVDSVTGKPIPQSAQLKKPKGSR